MVMSRSSSVAAPPTSGPVGPQAAGVAGKARRPARPRRLGSTRLAAVLAVISALVVTASGLLYVRMVQTQWADTVWLWLFQRFDVAGEANVAAWWAASLWMLFAVTAVVVGLAADRRSFLWYILAAIALYASADEASMLHEELYRVGGKLKLHMPEGLLSYSWVAAGIIVVLFVALVMLPLLWRLPRSVVVGLVLSGAVFLLGAVVIETVGGHIEQHFGQVTWHLMLAIQIEEMLEYLGVVGAIYSITRMVRVRRGENGLRVDFLGYRGEYPREPA